MNIEQKIRTNKLLRFPSKGYIGGVCHGVGEHTGLDPILWRIVSIFGGFWLIYLILWIVLKKGE
jgi:phage shock protein PspC (stress-responsive transcriptional regulator)